jgi:hypothetical protein
MHPIMTEQAKKISIPKMGNRIHAMTVSVVSRLRSPLDESSLANAGCAFNKYVAAIRTAVVGYIGNNSGPLMTIRGASNGEHHEIVICWSAVESSDQVDENPLGRSKDTLYSHALRLVEMVYRVQIIYTRWIKKRSHTKIESSKPKN